MGVGVFAAGLTILSVKLWTVLDKKRKAAQKRKFPGIIPGYSPLGKEWSGILSASLDSDTIGTLLSPEDQAHPPLPFSSEKQANRFYKKRLKALRVFIRSEGHNTNWHPDFSENSQSILYKRMAEYTESLALLTPTPEVARQTNSLAFDIALYLAKVKTGQFPTFDLFLRNFFLSDYFNVLDRLKSDAAKTPSSP